MSACRRGGPIFILKTDFKNTNQELQNVNLGFSLKFSLLLGLDMQSKDCKNASLGFFQVRSRYSGMTCRDQVLRPSVTGVRSIKRIARSWKIRITF